MKESEFSKYFTGKLKDAGFMVDRIETHSTVCGIPDIHAVGYGNEYWIELKSCPKLRLADRKDVKVPWRPGQQAWAIQYFARTGGRCSLTVVKAQDGIGFISMMDRFKDNIVPAANVYNYSKFISKHPKTLIPIIRHMAAQFDWDVTATVRDNIVRWVGHHLLLGSLDYDPDVLWGNDAGGHATTIEFILRKQDMFETLLWTFVNSIRR